MIPLQNREDLALDDSEHSFYTPRGGDWVLLALVIVTLLGTGLFAWHQLDAQGRSGDHAGRAIFFAFVIICIYWSATLYAFKLSVSIRVGPSSVSVLRGPWRTELPWREVVRLVERTQVVDGQRLRWAVALARDGRRMQIREDMVDDYVRFRMELYERYRLWRDHGGTWGTTGGGPFTTRETVSTQVAWWGVAAGLLLLPGLYFFILLPESGLVGPILLGIGLICVLLSLRALARRQTYQVDAKAIEASWFGRAVRLPWREVARVDRTRHTFNFAIKMGIVAGRFALNLAMRNDKRMRSFEWSPRVPEYLVIRGAGHQVRIHLHRLARPDELLAWVEFYERVGRRATHEETRRKKSGPPAARLPVREPAEAILDQSDDIGGPIDPWSVGAGGAPSYDEPAVVDSRQDPLVSADRGRPGDANWLRGDGESEHDDLFENEDEDQPTQKVPLAAMLAGSGSTDEPPEDDLEELPTAEMKAALARLKPSEVMPPTGSEIMGEAHLQHAPANTSTPAIPRSGPAGSGEIEEIPANHSLDQLWAPVRPLARERAAHHAPEPDAVRAASDAIRTAFAEMGLDPDESEQQPEANALDEVEKPQVEPVDTDDSLAESFAPWRDDSSWQPPALPRYGPPLPSEARPETEPDRQREQSEFSGDDFLR